MLTQVLAKVDGDVDGRHTREKRKCGANTVCLLLATQQQVLGRKTSVMSLSSHLLQTPNQNLMRKVDFCCFILMSG